MLARIRHYLDTYVDYPSAIAGASVLATIVFALNVRHGAGAAAIAAVKQGTYTFFVAGLIAKNNERLARRYEAPLPALTLAVSVSSAIAIGLTFLVHSLRGTPEPVLSTIPTAVLGPPGFLALALRARRSAPVGPAR